MTLPCSPNNPRWMLVTITVGLLGLMVGSEASTFVVTIQSLSSTQMDTVTSSINTQKLPAPYIVEQIPQSLIDSNDIAFEPIQTFMSGFAISSLKYSDVDYSWIISAKYVPNVPNTVTAMYLSKVGAEPYSSDVKNSFYVSEHPCMQSLSVCCLNDFKNSYHIGAFRKNITMMVGDCGDAVQSSNTQGMFDTSFGADQYLVNNVLSDFPDSRVVRKGPGLVDLYITETDVRFNMSMKETVNTGTALGSKLTFFVGMSYFTLLPANAVSTVSSQTKISITMTNSLTISFATDQDYTFIKYMTMNVFQNKWLENPLVERQMQYVRMGLVFPSDMQQNLRTGLIPLGSIRFSIATSLPDMEDPTKWTNPCYSKLKNGMWDTSQGWRALYAGAASQACATQANMCVNPLSSMLVSNLVEFFFPIGDGTINSIHFSENSVYYLFVYFDISVLDNNGRAISTKMSVKAPITSLSIAKACESVQVDFSLLSTTNVNLNLGLVGSESAWSNGILKYNSINQAAGGYVDTTLTTQAKSLQGGLITLIVQGDPKIFTSQLTSKYYLEIEHMTVLHFLDDQKFANVNRMMAQKTAYAVEKDEVSGTMKIRMTQDVLNQCNNNGLSCVVQHPIVADTVQNSDSVRPFATGLNQTDLTSIRRWLTTNLIGVSEFGDELANNMTSLVMSKYNIDNRVNKAFYINPGYGWVAPTGSPSQSILQLSDKLILVAIIVLKDTKGATVRRRLMSASFGSPADNNDADHQAPPSTDVVRDRRLLQEQPDTEVPGNQVILKPSDEIMKENLETLKQSSRSVQLPSISNQIDVGNTVSVVLGGAEAWNGLKITLFAKFSSEMSLKQVQNEISRRLSQNYHQYCSVCTAATPVFFNLVPETSSNTEDTTLYSGSISVWMSKREDVNKIDLLKLYQSMLQESFSFSFAACSDSEDAMAYCIANMDVGEVLLDSATPIWLDTVDETVLEWPDLTKPVRVISNIASMQVPPFVFGDGKFGNVEIELGVGNVTQPNLQVMSSLVVMSCQELPVKIIPIEVNLDTLPASRRLLQNSNPTTIKIFTNDPSTGTWVPLEQQMLYEGGNTISGNIQPTDFTKIGTRHQVSIYALEVDNTVAEPETATPGWVAPVAAVLIVVVLCTCGAFARRKSKLSGYSPISGVSSSQKPGSENVTHIGNFVFRNVTLHRPALRPYLTNP